MSTDLNELFSNRLEDYLNQSQNPLSYNLYHPERYTIERGGKRIRPYLVLLGALAAEGSASNALDAALSVELFHNFTLVHDDLLDKSLLRRGHPTVHKKWNANQAVLSGDVMFANAIHVLSNYPDELCGKLNKTLSLTAKEVCEGQQMDLDFENLTQLTESNYLEMIRLKTAVLLGCALKMGSITAQGSATLSSTLYQFGVEIGIAFQILDDYLDAFSDTGSAFGKTIGGDILNDKKTLLWVLSRSVAAEPILSLPSNHPEYSKHKIEAYLNWFKVTGAKDECIKRVTAYHDRAKNGVPDVSKNPEIQDLFYKLLYDLQQRLT